MVRCLSVALSIYLSVSLYLSLSFSSSVASYFTCATTSVEWVAIRLSVRLSAWLSVSGFFIFYTSICLFSLFLSSRSSLFLFSFWCELCVLMCTCFSMLLSLDATETHKGGDWTEENDEKERKAAAKWSRPQSRSSAVRFFVCTSGCLLTVRQSIYFSPFIFFSVCSLLECIRMCFPPSFVLFHSRCIFRLRQSSSFHEHRQTKRSGNGLKNS